MEQQIINQIVPVLVAAIFAVLTAVIKAVGDAAVKLIEKKKEAVEAKIGADTYNQRVAVAKQVWGIVDEYFRITPTVTKTIEAAQAKFTEEIKKLIPDITDEEIEHLRQAVAGEVNKGRDALTAPATASSASVTVSASATPATSAGSTTASV